MNIPKTAIELIPRNKEYLINKIQEIQDCNYDIVNLPHLRDRKWWEVCFMAPEEIASIENILPEGKELVLHLRSQDSHTNSQAITRINTLLSKKIKEILLITWDTYVNKNEVVTTHAILESIWIQEKVSICADLYHQDWWRFHKKIPFLKKNNTANIYTQPVFCNTIFEKIEKNKVQLWIPQWKTNIYIWITWICNSKTRDYWKNTNKVPEKYLPKWDTNEKIKENSIAQTIDILKHIKKEKYSSYIMLMQSKVKDLLSIQNKVENNSY